MGGNGSYSKKYRGVPKIQRTHIDTNMRIDGHKVLLQARNTYQNKNILNSNSDSPIYLIARTDSSGVIQIRTINVYSNHEISIEINLQFDTLGEYVAYDRSYIKSSHSHRWYKTDKGTFERMSHDRNNIFEVPKEYMALIEKIVKFNKHKRRWK